MTTDATTGEPTLDAILSYKNDAIVLRFQETWDLPIEDCEELFVETLKWLWLVAQNQKREEPLTLAISQSTKLLDEMWHTFILFSKDYHAFCDQYIGHYIHHVPTSRDQYDATIREYERDPESVMAKNEALFTSQYELIYDVLGEETLVKWYDIYNERYTDEYLRSIWRWSFSPYDTRVRERVRMSEEAGLQS